MCDFFSERVSGRLTTEIFRERNDVGQMRTKYEGHVSGMCRLETGLLIRISTRENDLETGRRSPSQSWGRMTWARCEALNNACTRDVRPIRKDQCLQGQRSDTPPSKKSTLFQRNVSKHALAGPYNRRNYL